MTPVHNGNALNFSDPNSILPCAVSGGPWWSADFVDDQQGFVDRVIGAWNTRPGNHLVLAPEQHYEVADEVFSLYQAAHRFLRTNRLNRDVLHALYYPLRKQSLSEAWAVLSDFRSALQQAAQPDPQPASTKTLPEREEVEGAIRLLEEQRSKCASRREQIEVEQDQMALRGCVKQSECHRHDELQSLRHELFSIFQSLQSLKSRLRSLEVAAA